MEKWVESYHNGDKSLFVDCLDSEAHNRYKNKQQEIYNIRKDQLRCGVDCTMPHVWGPHYKQDGLGYKVIAINQYLNNYLQRDNLCKLCMEFIFVQEYYICHPYEKEHRDLLVDRIIDAVLDDGKIDDESNLEIGLYRYIQYVLSEEHLYGIVMDYLIHCEEMGGINLFRDDIKNEIFDLVRNKRKFLLRDK